MWYAILYIFYVVCVLEFSVSLWGQEGDLSLPTEFISFCREWRWQRIHFVTGLLTTFEQLNLKCVW